MKDGYLVKICGTTNMEDALISYQEGADYFGVVVEVGFSKRSLTIEEAESLFANPPIPAVALVFCMQEERLRYLVEKLHPFSIQFLSQEAPELIRRMKKDYPGLELWQSVHLPCAGEGVNLDGVKRIASEYIDSGVDLLLFDTVAKVDGVQKFGGTGLTSDWSVVKELMGTVGGKVPVLLAGGIRPENVEEAISYLKPAGVDLCSGVEAYPGKKDPVKIKQLMRNVRKMEMKKL
ncbi:MAG: phosphoribosylanthranilate isomerase [Bacillota bacterium]|nr:phosphoribosylanthranilate isomerase [Bacillota bacterium]